MAEMRVAMTLNLLDAASPGVKAFMDTIASLEKVIAGLSARFSSTETAATGLGGSLGGISATVAKVGAEMEQLGVNTMLAGNAMLEQAVAAAKSDAALNMTAGATARLAAETTLLRDATVAQFAAATQATGGIAGIGGAAGAAITPVSGLGNAIKGMAELWAAFKIEKGLKESIDAASEFQKETMKVMALGLSPEATKNITDKAWDDSKVLKFASALDAVKARMAIIGGLAETGAEPMAQGVLDQMTPAVMKATNVLRLMGDKTDTVSMIRNLTAVFESRGQTADVEAMKKSLDIVVQAYSVTGGKVQPVDFDMFLRRFGQGALTMSDEAMREIVALIDQLKAIGGGGAGASGASQLAVALKMLQAYAIGKPMNKQGAGMLEESGIFGKNAGLDDTSTLMTNIRKGSSASDPTLAATDIIAFFTKYGPNIIAYTQRYMKDFYAGKDPNDPVAIDAAVQKYITMLGFSVTAAQALSFAVNPRSQARIGQQVEMMKVAPGVEGVTKIFEPAYAQNVINFNKALENLQITLGEKILPVLTPIIEEFTKFLSLIGGFASENPAFAQFIVLTGILSGLALVVAGIRNVFGLFGIAVSAMRGALPAVATETAAATGVFASFGAAIETASGAIGAFLLLIGRFFLRAIPLIGAAFVGWDLGKLFLGTDLGKAAQLQIGNWIDGIAGLFKGGVDKINSQTAPRRGGLLGAMKEQLRTPPELLALAGVSPSTAAETATSTAPSLGFDYATANSMLGRVNKAIPVPEYNPQFDVSGAKYGVSPDLLRFMAVQESGMNPAAVSGAGAKGLMQFMPGTAAGIGLENPLDPRQSIEAAAKLMRQLLDQFKGDLGKALLAYNAGAKVALGEITQSAANKAQSDQYTAALTGAMSGRAPILTNADRIRNQQLSDAKSVQLGEPKSTYDAVGEAAKQQLRLDEDDRKRSLHTMDLEYKAGKVGVTEYYDAIIAKSRESYAVEIADLRARADELRKDPKKKSEAAALDTEVILKERAAADADTNNKILKQEALDKLKQRELDIQILILQAEGKGREVTLARDMKKLEADRAAFTSSPEGVSPGAITEVNKAESIVLLENDYQKASDKITLIQKREKAAEADIANEVKAGTKTQFEGENAVYELRQKEALQMQELLVLLKQFMDASNAPQEVKDAVSDKMAGWVTQSKGALLELTPLMQKLKGIGDTAFSGFFSSIMQGGKSAKAIFTDLFNSIKKGIDDIVAKMLADQFTNWIKNAAGIGGAGGSGAGGGGLFGWIGNLFGGASSGGSTSSMAALAGNSGSMEGALLGSFAAGIDRVPNDMLAMIHKDEAVLNSSLAGAYRAGNLPTNKPMNTVNYFNVPAPTTTYTQSEIALQVGVAMQRVMRRNS